jgi:uncharacterized protein (DUF934 family)
MRRIIRRRELVADDARYADEGVTPGTRRVLPVVEYVAALAGAGAGADATPGALPDAILIGPTDDVEALAVDLHRLSLIVVEFPRIGEGRGFSQARLLRQRLQYRGELRARGALKRDQLFFLARCGFDSFDLDPTENLEAALGALDAFSVAYQDGSDELLHLQRRGASPA